jgi:hypothetical protein
MSSIFLCFALMISLALASEPTIRRDGDYLVSKHYGAIDYHVDLQDPFRLVDGANQLMAVGSMMLNKRPNNILDIGLGLGCLPRHFLNRYPSLTVTSIDNNYKINVNWGLMNKEYFGTNQEIQAQSSRFTMPHGDGLLTIEGPLRDQRFDVAWVDILDDRHVGQESSTLSKKAKKPKQQHHKRYVGQEPETSILYEADLYKNLRKMTNNGIVISLYKQTSDDIATIVKMANMASALHLTFVNADPSAQKHFSVLVLSQYSLDCSSVAKSAAAFPTNNIQTPKCKKL